MTIVIRVNAHPGTEQAIKESLAMYCEQFGDCRVLEIVPDEKPEEIRMEGF